MTVSPLPATPLAAATSRTHAERWFRRLLWLGIAANLASAVPSVLAPAAMLRLFRFPEVTPVMWAQFAALLLVLLSLFYMPAAIDPRRYRVIAWLAVGARLAGVVFFLGFQPKEYHQFGYFDLAFFVPQAVLLWMVSR